MTIHKEGYTSIALCILIIFVLNAFLQIYFPGANAVRWIVYILSALFFVSTVVFFRDPSISIITDEKAILSPADGKVITIEETDETSFLKDRRIKISIAIAPVNVHTNRNPVKGTVKYAFAGNGRTTTAVETNSGIIIVYEQIGGITKRVISHLKQGDTVEQGQKFGFSMLGARADVYLPIGTKINVEVDDAVKGGLTVLARINA